MSSIYIPEIITERLHLRKIAVTDKNNIFKGLSHPDIIKFYSVRYTSLQETEEQMKWYSNLEKSNSGMWWGIQIRESGDFCGALGINDYQKEHKKAEIGFWLFPEFWNNGYIQESASKIINYLFKESLLHRLEAHVESENENSAKALRKLGFKFEGRMIDCEIKNDRYISIDIFSMINPDY